MKYACICDWACLNRACGAQNLPLFQTLTTHNFLFRHAMAIQILALLYIKNANSLLQYGDMTCCVTECSLCPRDLFSQAQSIIVPMIRILICLFHCRTVLTIILFGIRCFATAYFQSIGLYAPEVSVVLL